MKKSFELKHVRFGENHDYKNDEFYTESVTVYLYPSECVELINYLASFLSKTNIGTPCPLHMHGRLRTYPEGKTLNDS